MATAKPQRLRSKGLRPVIGPSFDLETDLVPGFRPAAGHEGRVPKC